MTMRSGSRYIDIRRLLVLALTALAMAVSGTPAAASTMHAPNPSTTIIDHAGMSAAHAADSCGEDAEGIVPVHDEDCCSGDCDGCVCTACHINIADISKEAGAGAALFSEAHDRRALSFAARAPDVPKSPPKPLS